MCVKCGMIRSIATQPIGRGEDPQKVVEATSTTALKVEVKLPFKVRNIVETETA